MAVGKNDKKVSALIYGTLSFVAAVVLLVAGLGLWKTGASTVDMVNNGLVKEKIYFPPDSAAFPKAEKYAGQQVTDGAMAKAYAEDVVGVQLEGAANGKTLSEVSAELAADPQNAQLAALQGAMFQMNTSKTLLLSAGYAPWAQGVMMKNLGVGALLVGALLLLVGAVHWMRYKRM